MTDSTRLYRSKKTLSTRSLYVNHFPYGSTSSFQVSHIYFPRFHYDVDHLSLDRGSVPHAFERTRIRISRPFKRTIIRVSRLPAFPEHHLYF